MRLTKLIAGVMSGVLVAGACPGADIDTPERLVDANNRFTAEIYKRVKDKEGNLFLSPYSISSALAMVYAGAQGNTAKEMADTLHFKDIPQPEVRVHEYCRMLQTGLNAIQKKGDIKLAVANSLWPQKSFKMEDAFIARGKTYYGADVTPVDFVTASEDARKKINTWVEDKTQEKIKDLIKQGMLNDLTRLVLVNAIYFKGKWENEFDKKLTSKMEFDSGAAKVQADMMTQEKHVGYADTEDVQVLQLGYKGGDMSMVIVLPKNKADLGKIEDKLSNEVLAGWTRKMGRPEVKIFIPKFKVTSEFSLSGTLAAMGMKDAFDAGKADLSGISKGPDRLFISAVAHKAFVDVNEEGTEAAAATGIMVGTTAMPAEPLIFRADHPFLFVIRENKTGSILFIGRVVDPTKG
ncbi:MAG: serpin family protein [Verrucomicrobia bacterium]|nr:serpin family protein [Verrucomicrobiota bacterium]